MKKIAFPLILALIVGVAAGYLIRKMSEGSGGSFTDASSLTADQKAALKSDYENNAMLFSGQVNKEPVDSAKASVMIGDFRSENEGSDYGLMTVEKKKLRGFYIEKKYLIDALVPGSTGLSFYFAKADGATTPRTYTLVFMGARDTGTVDNPKITNIFKMKGDNPPQDYIKPCPDHCGDFK